MIDEKTMGNLIQLRRELERDQSILDTLDEKIQEHSAWPTSAVYQVAGILYFSVRQLSREIMHLENQQTMGGWP